MTQWQEDHDTGRKTMTQWQADPHPQDYKERCQQGGEYICEDCLALNKAEEKG
jgi:hypothetical protein